ncbi:MAG: DUF547 domain-containing protein [Gammaproteobacteria bacterium]
MKIGMRMKALLPLLAALLSFPLLWTAQMVKAAGGFDLSHRAWTELLAKHVVLIDHGRASGVAYADLQSDSGQLRNYLQSLSAVSQSEFAGWSKDDRLALLINAYNAFTLKLILTRYPKLESIKDLGSLLRSPWKQRFFTLLGQEQSLDEIEHGIIRKPGVFDDPRIHFAVNCASIGCPMLREEAYVGARLDAQLDDQVMRFLSDRTRNRYSEVSKSLQVSSIFEWYAEDFSRGYRGIRSVQEFLAPHAEVLADRPADQALNRTGQAPLDYLDYDWGLNDRKPQGHGIDRGRP